MDIWGILGISSTTDQKEIRKAYAVQSKVHHAETDPEGFQQLYQAYQKALEYAKKNEGRQTIQPPVKAEEVRRPKIPFAVVRAKLAKSALSAKEQRAVEGSSLAEEEQLNFGEIFQDWEEEDKEAYFSEGALHTFISLFSLKKACCSQNVWKEFFLSDEFLDVQYDEKFIQYLAEFLNTQDIMPPHKLPQALCIELFIAYSLYYIQQDVVDKELLLPLVELMRKQEALRSTLQKLPTKDFASRQEAFYRYNKLVGSSYRTSGQYRLEDWIEVLQFTQGQYLSVEDSQSVPRPAEFFMLLAYLVRNRTLPEEIYFYLYDLYDMDHFERSSSKKQIQILYDELKALADPQTRQLRKQKREEKEFDKKVFIQYYLLYETTLQKSDKALIEEFFSDADFLKAQYQTWFIQKMEEFYKTYKNISPELHQATLRAYQQGEGKAEQLLNILLSYKGKK